MFSEEYEAMPLHRKVMENPYLVVGVVASVLLLAVGLLASAGIV